MCNTCTRPLVVRFLLVILWPIIPSLAKEPQQTPDNTISIHLPAPVKPQAFPQPVKFYVREVIDRSGDPDPYVLLRERSVFLDQEPKTIVRAALEDSLRSAGELAAAEGGADYSLTVYVFHFGLAEGSGFELYCKVDLYIEVKDLKSGQVRPVTALGTSIGEAAVRMKNLKRNLEVSLDEALSDAIRNFLCGVKLREALGNISAASTPGE